MQPAGRVGFTFTADHHLGFAPARAGVLAERADAAYGAASSGGRSRT